VRVIAIFGPTAVGKTAVAIELADLLRERGENPVAISADSMQVYEGLGTLTGAASPEEQRRLEHRLLGSVPITQSYSVGEYMQRAHAEIDAALAGGRRPIVVGGTGLYLRAALTELELRPPVDPEIRARIAARIGSEGVEALRQEVLRRAPGSRIAEGDRNRVIRYLELLEAGLDPEPGDTQLWSESTRQPTLLVGLVMDRDELNRKIDERMEAIAAAAIEEVRAADAAGASNTARKAYGFEELLRGDVEAMKLKARQLARRQLSWMRKLGGVHTINVTGRDPHAVAKEILRLSA
jgi:tRNA dimethylallyltransferase